MKTEICLSITQLRNLVEAAEYNAASWENVNEIVVIRLEQQTDVQGKADKCRFYLQSSFAECDDMFIGHN